MTRLPSTASRIASSRIAGGAGDAGPTAAVQRTGTVGVLQGSALYISAVLGTGILVLPGLAADAAGPASILAVAAVLLLSVPLAGTFAALAARFPDAGGVATFVRLALGKTPARMAGYWFFFGVVIGTPVVAVLGASYLVAIFGGPRWAVIVLAVLLLVPPFLSNAYGLRVSGPVQLGLTAALVAIVVGVMAVCGRAMQPAHFEPFLPHGWAGVGTAVSLFVWAFAGWEAVTHLAGEFKNPRRTIPLATGIAIVVVGAAYLALQVLTVGVLGAKAESGPVPLLTLVASTTGETGQIIVAVIAAVVALGVLNAYVGAFAKLGASLGRDGDLPRWFAAGVEPGQVPRRSLVIVAVLTGVYLSALVLTGLDLLPFILIHTSSMVAVYFFGMLAAVRLLHRFSLGWWLGIVSLVLTAGLLLLAGAHLLVPAGLAAAALLVALFKHLRNPIPTQQVRH
ncbi:amino acid permease [Arthrobacter sp. AL08]|uniref:APC family permease n=1 Tax=unclassified Arthrobacter TaxID=235627 RepID=UPI00249AE8C9|nr:MULTISPECIES: amino acid permease [unclassified Arthrobacter]MDI3243326.1 amino acid permease [Arthrobacter sp. AL05]MDI3279335.1 amino acid permease [Arthrobacter sp. AL08]